MKYICKIYVCVLMKQKVMSITNSAACPLEANYTAVSFGIQQLKALLAAYTLHIIDAGRALLYLPKALQK